MNSVQIKVAESIANITPKVEDQVVEVLVERELEKRATAIVKAMDTLSKFEGELKKIRPDQTSFSETGEKISETYSKAKLEEKNKLQQKIDKNTKAINKALETGDYQDVYNLNKQGGEPSRQDTSDIDGEAS